MSARRLGTTRARAAALAVMLGALAACTGAAGTEETDGPAGEAGSPKPPAIRVVTNLVNEKAVTVDKVVEVSSSNATLERVVVRAADGTELAGRLTPEDVWRSQGRLEPGTSYTIRSLATAEDGRSRRTTHRFRTVDLSLDEQTYASIAPLDGETVGVGMPVIVSFDVPVTDKASIERHLTVTSAPAQRGAWHWISDYEVHWRPVSYWRAGTDVEVDVDVNSVPAGNGIFGQESRRISFHVGDANVYKVNAQTHQMQVFQNGSLLRTIPITTGKEGFTTRSGTKVIIEKFREKRMNSETVGISRDNPEYYDIDDVEYAMRLTYSGEFIHAAPWSVGSQGEANVSHGCTGMSTANAEWLYNMTRRGDVVEYTGTDRWMTMTNGYGDWNVPFAEYRAGSALS